MMEFVPGTEDSGEAVFGYFLGEMSPDGMTDSRMTGVQALSLIGLGTVARVWLGQ